MSPTNESWDKRPPKKPGVWEPVPLQLPVGHPTWVDRDCSDGPDDDEDDGQTTPAVIIIDMDDYPDIE